MLSNPSLARSAGNIARASISHAEQIADRGRVLGAIQPMHGLAARRGTALARRPRRDSPRATRRARRPLLRPASARPAAASGCPRSLRTTFSHSSGLAATSADLHMLERALARKLGVVVAIRAVAAEDAPVRRDRLLGRALAGAQHEREPERDADRSQLGEPSARRAGPYKELVSRPGPPQAFIHIPYK